MVIFMICLIYVILGTAMESLSMMLLTVPIFFPLVTALGFDPVWFGIIVVCVIEISLITPPVGMNIFVLSSMMPSLPTSTIWRGVMPFIVADIARMTVLVLFPALSLFLPKWLGL
jgi:TRAP-type C4-dicarboxylate transport system permease large subunit